MNSAVLQHYLHHNTSENGNKKRIRKTHVEEYPTVKLSDLAGIEYCVQDIRDIIERPLKYAELYGQLGISPARGLLMSGPSGCGKTFMAHAIAGEYNLRLIKVSSCEIVSGVPGESESKLWDLFNQAKIKSPCILLMDELDSIVTRKESSLREAEKRIISQLAICMDELSSTSFVMVIGITSRAELIDPSLRRPGRFEHEIQMCVPDQESRCKILELFTRKLKLGTDLSIKWIARNTPGYSGADLKMLVREAALICIHRNTATNLAPMDLVSKLEILQADVAAGLKKVQPSGKREGFAVVPDVSWTDIGALETVREELGLLVVKPLAYPELFRRIGINDPAGVLLWGPPGCGKTLLAKAVANESHSNFISIKGPELFHKYVGESERAVRRVFERAKASRPCIIFFDELDSLCPRRSDENNHAARLVNQFLTEMDGLEERQQVYIMAATNRPDMIDPAITRPGRLDRLIYVRLPNAKERHEILLKQTRKLPLDSGIDLEVIAYDCRLEGFSGADLNALVREAGLAAIKQVLSKPEPREFGNAVVTFGHFSEALERVFPSVSVKDREMYDELYLEYTSKRR